jgi:PASTA domain
MSADAASAAATAHAPLYLGGMAVLILLIGMLILWIRCTLGKNASGHSLANADKTMIRSWLAVVLVAGLLLFATGSFFIANANLQNLLMGGVIASAGTAVAFYFSSKSSEQTQQNLLNAALGGQIILPDLTTGTVSDAQKIAGALQLTLVISPPGSATADLVTSTSPPPGSMVRPGAAITVTAEPPT